MIIYFIFNLLNIYFLLYCGFIYFFFFFFNDTATTEIYTLSLHDALPISCNRGTGSVGRCRPGLAILAWVRASADRKSTRLNSSHVRTSYAFLCLKKKLKKNQYIT